MLEHFLLCPKARNPLFQAFDLLLGVVGDLLVECIMSCFEGKQEVLEEAFFLLAGLLGLQEEIVLSVSALEEKKQVETCLNLLSHVGDVLGARGKDVQGLWQDCVENERQQCFSFLGIGYGSHVKLWLDETAYENRHSLI